MDMNQAIMLLPYITFFLMLRTSRSSNTIAMHQNISDGETIVSLNAKFELGFFSPGNSKSRYMGIWFKCMSPKTIAWVANRETPLIDTSGVVKLDSQGNLILVNGSGKVIWSSNSSASGTNIILVAQLLDTGNLVVKKGNKANNETFIWQSFDYPGDTYLNGMKLGKNFITGRETYLRSWRSSDNPFPGDYTSRVFSVKGKYPQVYIRRSSEIKTRIGPYNGISFSGWANYAPDANLGDHLSCMIMNQNETYITCFTNRNTNTLRAIVTPDGKLEFSEINFPNPEWISIATLSVDYCDNYGVCGPYGSCTTDTSPNCGCLKGFELKNIDNDTIVCQRRIALNCGPGEGFLKFSSTKLPDTENAIFSSNMSLLDCEVACKNNCSCTAYANPIITSGGVGCLLWYGGLIDVRVYPQNGQDLYVRLADSELSICRASYRHSTLGENGRRDQMQRAATKWEVQRGYISPEYAVNGLYSIKSDIFNFGVLVLEIVSGKKNRGFVHEDHADNLLGHMLLPYITFFLMLRTSSSSDTIAVLQNISDGETIVSGKAKFELGFFSPGNSKNRYLGIWFKNTSSQTIAWVANRETPLTDTSGAVRLDNQGYLTLVNGSGKVIWTSNSSASGTGINLVAQLLDTGNLVIKNGNEANNEIFIWQSFDYPGDTFIEGMKLGKNFITGRETYLTSWRSADDPSPGEYTLRFLMIKGKYQQLYIRKSSAIETRIGPYNGISFSGRPLSTPDTAEPPYVSYMVVNQNEMYFATTSKNNTTTFLSRTIVTPGGKLEILQQKFPNREWITSITLPVDYCDNYGVCGPYGSCDTATSPYCGCLRGFERKTSDEMSPDNDISVCRRSIALDCGPGERFKKFSSMKLPDTENAVFSGNMSLQDCEAYCKNNCSCAAYANPNITGCLLWFGGLLDVRVYQQNGQDLYVRLAASEFRSHGKKRVVMVVTLSISVVLTILGLIFALYIRRNWKRGSSAAEREGGPEKTLLDKDYKATSSQMRSVEVPLFSLSKISVATNDFSVDNKLGEGGFGPVYKGVLEEGQEIAVKRLSKGYISPEYAVNGLYSVKSDIFSFGVLVLEIVCGKKNRGFIHEGHDDNLLGHAWRLYKEDKSLDLIDECLLTSYSNSEVLRSVHVGLLCVQQRVEDRPNTPTVVAMLGGEGSLPSPKKPAFFFQESEINSTSVLPLVSSSVNGITLSQVDVLELVSELGRIENQVQVASRSRCRSCLSIPGTKEPKLREPKKGTKAERSKSPCLKSLLLGLPKIVIATDQKDLIAA
ncbi:hypothetical protein L1987_11508 [Smallanthus sonchifolius]|uniref:Uncharacterized protein n=1 Tax=Smallanthus sonchifolius TaxID=185202 RepID=A0ACB9JBQ2_9ASTR|nr:hypothetical protein L1987_11508 [Smallanthus sonchifolius]